LIVRGNRTNWSPGGGKERIGSRSKIEGTLDEDLTLDKEKNEEKESNGKPVTLEEGLNSIQRRDTERLRVTEAGVEAFTFRYVELACSNKRSGHCLKKCLPVFPASTDPGEGFTRSKS
jgi:hypothetical protein